MIPDGNLSRGTSHLAGLGPPRNSSHTTTKDKSQTEARNGRKSRRKHVTTACLLCKDRKAKCNGALPCIRCTSRNLVCVYPLDADGRGHTRLRQRIENLERQNRVLTDVIEAMKDIQQGQPPSSAPLSGQLYHPTIGVNEPTILDDDAWEHAFENEHAIQRSRFELEEPRLTQRDSAGCSNVQGVHQRARDNRHGHAVQRYLVPGSVTSFGNLPMSSAFLTNNYPDVIQQQQVKVLNSSLETCLPLHHPMVSNSTAGHLSHALQSFRSAACSMIASGADVSNVLSMDGVDMTLFFRDRQPSDPYTVSTTACELAKLWTVLSRPHQYAGVFVIASFLRWYILPCRKTYEMMISSMRPSLSQLFIPHTADVDLCPVPSIRDAQLKAGDNWADRVRADPEIQRVSWPYDIDLCIEYAVLTPGSKPVQTLSAPFIHHIKNLQNWSVSRKAVIAYPELQGVAVIHES